MSSRRGRSSVHFKPGRHLGLSRAIAMTSSHVVQLQDVPQHEPTSSSASSHPTTRKRATGASHVHSGAASSSRRPAFDEIGDLRSECRGGSGPRSGPCRCRRWTLSTKTHVVLRHRTIAAADEPRLLRAVVVPPCSSAGISQLSFDVRRSRRSVFPRFRVQGPSHGTNLETETTSTVVLAAPPQRRSC